MINPCAQPTGPEFVLYYAILVALTAGLCWWLRERSDPTRALPLPALSEPPDPYEIAYLQGGEKQLASIAIVRLTDLGYLRVEERKEHWWKSRQKYIEQKSPHPGSDCLSVLERRVFEWFEPGRRIEEVFTNDVLLALSSGHGSHYEEKLHSEQLLTSDSAKEQAKLRMLTGIAVVGAIGGARLIAGVLGGFPVGLLLFLAIAGAGAIAASSTPGRLSYRGREYLAALREKCEALRISPMHTGSAAVAASLFGLAILAGTSYGALADAFKKSQSSSGFSVGGDGGCGGCGGCCG